MYEIGDEVIYQGADKSAYKRRGVVASIEEKDGKPQLTVAFGDGEEFTAPIDDWSRAFTNASVCNEVKFTNPNYNPVEGMKYLEKHFSMFDPKYAKAMIDDAMRKGVKIPSGLLEKAKAAGMIANSRACNSTNATVRNALNARTAKNGYVVLRTASGTTQKVYEGGRVAYDGKPYKVISLGSPQLDKATIVDDSGAKVVVRLKDPNLLARNAINARTAKNDITPYGAVSGILALRYYGKKDDVGNGVMIVRAPKDEVEKYLRARAGSYPYKIEPYRGGKWTKVTASTTWNAQTAKNADTGKEFYNKIVLPVNALIASFSDVVQTANRYTEGLRIKPQINEVRSAIEKLKASLAELRG